MKLSGLILITTFILAFASAQPEGRVSAKFIYHPPSQSLLLIDGYQIHPESATENSVWSWNGKEWKKIAATGPESRSLSSGALNTRTNDVVMFGGVGKKNYETLMEDVWRFDGKAWAKLPVNSIGSRDHHQMVYMDHLEAYVIYGGQNADRKFDSATYILKDNKFSKLDIPGPGARFHFGMAYDRSRQKVVLFSGGTRKSSGLDDTIWEFDGKKWEQINPTQKISGRVWPTFVYHEKIKMVLMHGGKAVLSDGQFDFSDETWGWDGNNWKLVARNGPRALLIAVGYDPKRDVVVAFGGSGNTNMSADLWELKDSAWKKIQDQGTWEWKVDKYVKVEKH